MGIGSHHVFFVCAAVLALAGWSCAHAQVLLKAQEVSAPGISLHGLTASFDEHADDGMSVRLVATKVDMPAMGWRRVGLSIDGTMQRDERLRWVFAGDLRLGAAPGGALGKARIEVAVNVAANTLVIDVRQGSTRIGAWLPLDQTTHAQITLKKLPAAWLQGLLSTIWSGRTTAGRIDGELALDVRDAGVQSSGTFGLQQVAFDTPTGTLAAQDLTAAGRYSLDTTRGPAQIDLDASLTGGEVLIAPIYANLPDHAVQLGLHATTQNGAIEFSRLRLNDPDALQLDGALGIDATGAVTTLKLTDFHASFPAANERYGEAWLETLGLHQPTIAGEVNGGLDLQPDGLHSFTFNTPGLDLSDGDDRAAITGLRGTLDWARGQDRPATTLAWRTLRFYRLPFGGAQSTWQSQNGTLGLRQALEIPVLNGTLRIGTLDWRPDAARGQRLSTSLALTQVDMAAFSQAMGWPAFPGTLGGAIPSLRWVDDRVELDGGLSATLFDGYLDLTRLSLQKPLSAAPVLVADIAMRHLDLGLITSVFDFGTITGRLDASIDGLRLVGWNPVAFKARMLADDGGRISQRAVDNLTAVGGGGVVAGLQGAMLKLFKTFGYKRIGVNCTLQGSVCQMSGLETTDGGYTILEGSGLPHLRVIGHQTQVDWPTLVRRLRDAVEGAAPEVR